MKIDKNKGSRQKHNYGGNNNLGTSIRNMLYDQIFSLSHFEFKNNKILPIKCFADNKSLGKCIVYYS